MNCLRALILVLLSATTIAEEAPYYMWTDENGVLNFSRIPPTDATATELSSAKPKEFRHTYEPRAEPVEIETGPDVASLEADDAGIKSEDIAAYNEEVRLSNCHRAEQTLKRLSTSQAIILRGTDGLWREVDEDARAGQIEATQSEIAEFCEPEPTP